MSVLFSLHDISQGIFLEVSNGLAPRGLRGSKGENKRQKKIKEKDYL